tara:strand:+ start:391 stop:531 length:141 start_codon:yes stop_codon:yes gene_type:complete
MTKYGGRQTTLEQRYEIYLSFADDGEGGDNTRNGEPLLTFEEWLER